MVCTVIKNINYLQDVGTAVYKTAVFIMKKEEILSLLKKISYPGFSRDIVSFGMIDDVVIEQDKIQITLKLNKV